MAKRKMAARGASKKKLPRTKVSSPKPPSNEDDASDGAAAAVGDVADQIINAFRSSKLSPTHHVRGDAIKILNRHDDDGTIEQALWPWFISAAAASLVVEGDESSASASTGESTSASGYGERAAFALAVLSNRRGGATGGSSSIEKGGGTGGGDPQLSFVVDEYDYSRSSGRVRGDGVVPSADNEATRMKAATPGQRTTAFALLLKSLLSYQDNALSMGGNFPIAMRTEVIKFLITSYSSAELRCKPSSSSSAVPASDRQIRIVEGPLVDLVGIRLWDAVPRRRRHLEMRRNGLLRKRYGLFEARRVKGGQKNAGFLPGVVVTLIEFVSALGSGNQSDDLDANASLEDKQSAEQLDEKRQSLLMRGYVSKTLELLLDLLSHPKTRTHVSAYLSSLSVVVRLASSRLYQTGNFVLFRQQVQMLLDSDRVDTVSEMSLSGGNASAAMGHASHERAHTLQKMLHRHHAGECAEVIFAGVGRVTDSKWLQSRLSSWNEDTIYSICRRLRLVDDAEEGTAFSAKLLGCSRRELLCHLLLYHVSSRKSDADVLSSAPLYPTEELLWDEHSVPPGIMEKSADGGDVEMALSLPKLNGRFLSAGDYLLRNFRLFRLESAYEIRADIVDVVKRMRPTLKQDGYTQEDPKDYYGGNQNIEDHSNVGDQGGGGSGPFNTEFAGWARMGLELGSVKRLKPGLRLIRVDPPKLGESIPSAVVAEVVLDLFSCATSLAKEWDEIGEFDNLFLVSVDARKMSGELDKGIPDEQDCSFPQRYGVQSVRGCMVLEYRDEAGALLSDPALEYEEGGRPEPKGKLRYLRVALDPAQFAEDAIRGKLGIYNTFNLIVRRHGRENNFRAVLETIRGLMRGGANSVYRSVPSWLLPILLGFGGEGGDAPAPHYKIDAMLDYGDTFIGVDHLRDSFPGCELTVDGKKVADDDYEDEAKEDGGDCRKKFRVRVVEQPPGAKNKARVEARSYPSPPHHAGNTVRFTPVQVNAIRSGLSPGLTTVIGPPGTGKTDVAVQIVSNLYHSFPSQRTVVVTHSNAALNDIFDKVVARGDVDERHALRLGSGERDLQTPSSSLHDFTKSGRVAHIQSQRAKLLEEVQRLSEVLGVSGKGERGANGAPSYTCETAEYFYSSNVKGRVEAFEAAMKEREGAKAICDSNNLESKNTNILDIFPFKRYFHELESATSMSPSEARVKVGKIKSIFEELAEHRPIELLRSQRQRTNYLLTKQVRIVAMTCTHAAIARSQLVELGFRYDNVVVEEAGQMLDVETFVPLLLQRGESDDGSDDCDFSGIIQNNCSRLKRVVLIGDHNQLPPVVKNRAFAIYSRYDQSMFARLVRLGMVPTIELNRQGRSRPEIARLFSWRYDDLGDLDHVVAGRAYKGANPGLAHTFQLINVEDFEGRGESTPTPYFYQNVGEAEYAIALFQYMVLLGYPPEKISILTTYNGQKDLLIDILSQRCGEGTPLAGVSPGAVSTVDKYQGRQNDYVILSLVRTRSVGHVRDIRRLVVAVSRARLGLYVLCRSNLFCSCRELRRTMDQFAAKPSKLTLVKGEHYPVERIAGENVPAEKSHMVADVTEMGALVHSMQQEHVAGKE